MSHTGLSKPKNWFFSVHLKVVILYYYIVWEKYSPEVVLINRSLILLSLSVNLSYNGIICTGGKFFPIINETSG